MKLHGAHIAIPFFDTEGMKQWVAINITDWIDRRRIWRGVRKYVQDAFGVRVNNSWVRSNCRIVPMYTYDKKEVKDFTQVHMDELCVKLMEQCEHDEAEGSNDREASGSNPEATELSVSSLSETFNRRARP